MRVVVCSKNKAKNKAVENVIKDFIKDYEIVSLDTESLVSETPMSNEEGIEGCLSETAWIRKRPRDTDAPPLHWALDSPHNSYGCSAFVHVPKEIIKDLSKDERLSDLVAKYYGNTEEEVRNYGTNGMLTNGCYTRTDEFTDSVLCAISSIYPKNITRRVVCKRRKQWWLIWMM